MEVISAKNAMALKGPRPHRPYAVCSADVCGRFRLSSQFVSVKFVLDGEERYSGEFGSHSVYPSRYLLAAPGVALDVEIKPRTRGFCAFFDRNMIIDLLRDGLGEDIRPPGLFEPTGWTTALPVNGSAFSQELQNAALVEKPLDHDYYCRLLARSLLQNAKAVSRLPYRRESSKRDLFSRLEVARTYISENLDKMITLHALAEEACLSPYHLNRSFSAAYGAPPLRYAQNLRLDIALNEITSGKSISAVAENAGFSSVSAFSRAYLRRHGRRPSADFKK